MATLEMFPRPSSSPLLLSSARGKTSPLTGKPVQVCAAGGLFNGQSLAASLMLGASGVWVGTRFVLSKEAGGKSPRSSSFVSIADADHFTAPKAHKEAVRSAGFDDNVRTIIFTGRPLRVRSNEYIKNWEENRQADIKDLTDKGKIPVEHDFETMGDDMSDEMMDNARPFLMGKASAVVNDEKSAKEIVDEFVNDAVKCMSAGSASIVGKSKL